jgi:flagellar basal-body rod protein FlgB
MLKQSFESVDLFKKVLDASWLKSTAISKNIANVNTPGYKREVVEFDSILKNYLDQSNTKMKITDPKHIAVHNQPNGLEPQVRKLEDTSFRKDQNNVNIDVEMSEFSKNLIKYNAMTQQVTANLKRLRLAVRDGR